MVSQMRLISPDISANAPSTRPPLYFLSAVTIGLSERDKRPFRSLMLAARYGVFRTPARFSPSNKTTGAKNNCAGASMGGLAWCLFLVVV